MMHSAVLLMLPVGLQNGLLQISETLIKSNFIYSLRHVPYSLPWVASLPKYIVVFSTFPVNNPITLG